MLGLPLSLYTLNPTIGMAPRVKSNQFRHLLPRVSETKCGQACAKPLTLKRFGGAWCCRNSKYVTVDTKEVYPFGFSSGRNLWLPVNLKGTIRGNIFGQRSPLSFGRHFDIGHLSCFQSYTFPTFIVPSTTLSRTTS
jgi:hypothetical protein